MGLELQLQQLVAPMLAVAAFIHEKPDWVGEAPGTVFATMSALAG